MCTTCGQTAALLHGLQELREEFDKHGWLLTAALGVGPDTVDAAYNIPALSRYLDYMHAMCYDLHGSWDNRVGANAPLRSSQPDDKLTVVNSFLHVYFTCTYLWSAFRSNKHFKWCRSKYK
jgi:GH18 family chitinase